MLSGMILVHNIRRRVQHRTCSQQSHRSTENQAKIEAENNAANDDPESDQKTDLEKTPHEREIFLRDEHR